MSALLPTVRSVYRSKRLPQITLSTASSTARDLVSITLDADARAKVAKRP